MSCRTGSNTLGVFSPFLPGIRYQQHFEERAEKGGAGTHGLMVLQHRVKAQVGWSKLQVVAMH